LGYYPAGYNVQIRWDSGEHGNRPSIIHILTCLPCSQENSVDGQKSTSTVGSPNTTKTNPPPKKPFGWMTGRIKGCSVCCAYWPACLSPKRTPSTVRNSPPHLVRQTPQKQTHPKKQSGRMTGWIKGYSVCCVCATAAATKTNPPIIKTVRQDDGTDLGLL
jgi:hypothetical protein